MISVITCSVRPEGLAMVEKALARQTHRDFEWIVEGRSELKPGSVWDLNASYNRAIRKAKGDLIISWQDYTSAKPDAIMRFYEHYRTDKKTIISGVGDKYEDKRFLVKTWQDPRRTDGTLHRCPFNDIEFNLCAIPKQAFYDVGGFDEELDNLYGMDGFSVMDRLNIVGGYRFYLDEGIESFSLEHGRVSDWEEKNAIHVYQEWHNKYLNRPTLPYLA